MIDAQQVRADFEIRYQEAGRVFSAPGRVNLIGEHTDYNAGFGLPMAIDRRTYVAGAPRDDSRVHVYSSNTNNSVEFDLRKPGPTRRGSWVDYIEGTARALVDRGFAIGGA